jgi:polysaccharide pyruvyl transferase WcaK-like protein
MPRPFRLCLILHSTRSDNLGVGALTVSEVEILRRVGREAGRELEITIMDWKDPRPPYVTGPDIRLVDLDGKTMIRPSGYFAQARRADLVIDIGGGDSFADIYGTRRLNRMFLLKFLTHIAGTPLVMAPQTIGPFTRPLSSLAARLTMRLCAVVATRDALSTAAARKMGVTRPIVEASDVALRLPYDAPARVQTSMPRVGINVSGLLMGGGYTGKNEFGLKMDYPGLIRDLIRDFQARGAEVHLVPHVIVRSGPMQGEDDYRASQALGDEFPGTVLAPAFASPSEAKSYIAGMDYFIGARMHACVAAFSSGVPVVPMAYSRKFEGLFGSLGYNRTVDCTNEPAEAIRAKVLAGFDDRAGLTDEARVAFATGLEKLGAYETALRDLIDRIATKKRL